MMRGAIPMLKSQPCDHRLCHVNLVKRRLHNRDSERSWQDLRYLASHETVNLTNRQADVALRLVDDRSTLPEHLFGIRLHDVHRGVYIAPELLRRHETGKCGPLKWVLKVEDGVPPDWAQYDLAADAATALKVTEVHVQVAAVKASMGVTILPCFIGDSDPGLVRVPGTAISRYGTLWLLTHGEPRKPNAFGCSQSSFESVFQIMLICLQAWSLRQRVI